MSPGVLPPSLMLSGKGLSEPILPASTDGPTSLPDTFDPSGEGVAARFIALGRGEASYAWQMGPDSRHKCRLYSVHMHLLKEERRPMGCHPSNVTGGEDGPTGLIRL